MIKTAPAQALFVQEDQIMKSCVIQLRSYSIHLLTTVLCIAGMSGCGTANNTYGPLVKSGGGVAQPGFTLGITPSSAAVVSGNAASYTVTVTNQNGFNSPVTLSASNLPTGATAAFGEPTATATGETVPLSVQTALNQVQDAIAAKSAGSRGSTTRLTGTANITFTITGVGGGVTETATAVISITGAPDFSIAVQPGTVTVQSGTTANYSVVITSLQGFDVSKVLLSSVSGVPNVASASFGKPAATATGETIPLTVQTGEDGATTAGNYTLSFTGSASGITHSASCVLAVTGFTVSVSPDPVTTTVGKTLTFTVTVTGQNGFSSPVTLTALFEIAGVGVTFGSNTVTPTAAGATTTMTVTSSSESTPTGIQGITVNGTSGQLLNNYGIQITYTGGEN
jgi:hypothetical protein